MLRTEKRSIKTQLKRAKFEEKAKQRVKKILWDKDLYATDFRKRDATAELLLVRFFMKGGNYLKAKALLRTTYSSLYKLLLFVQPLFLKKQFKFFETLGQIVLHDSTWFCFNNLLTYYINKIKPLFYIQSISIARTFRKKKKILKISPFRLFLKQLPEHKRFNFGVREFSLYIKSIKRFKFTDRIFLGMLNLFMLDKQAFLFKKKIKCYRSALRSYIIDKDLR